MADNPGRPKSNRVCADGDRHAPLGFLSLIEKVMMFAMALWMLSPAA